MHREHWKVSVFRVPLKVQRVQLHLMCWFCPFKDDDTTQLNNQYFVSCNNLLKMPLFIDCGLDFFFCDLLCATSKSPLSHNTHLQTCTPKPGQPFTPNCFSTCALFPLYSSIPRQSATVINRPWINHFGARWTGADWGLRGLANNLIQQSGEGGEAVGCSWVE